jgi:putative endonuclease
MFYTYVLYDKNKNKFYIGYTNDIKRRLHEHELGNVHTTARFSTLRLIFYEYFISQNDAKRRESYFKTSKGKKSLRLILRDSLRLN